MQALADRIILLEGWPRRLAAAAAGAIGALALAPLNIGPALVVTMTVAVWLLDGVAGSGTAGFDRRAAAAGFGIGWWLGFGYFLAGFWWLGAAFIIDPEFTWLLPVGVLGMPAGLALFPAVGFALARLLWVPGPGRVLALALGLGVTEWARGHLFTGFPWNSFGMGLGGTLVTAQAAALVGLDGLTFLTVALCAAPATLFDARTGAGRVAPPALALAVTALLAAYGGARLLATAQAFVPKVVIRIMQPGLRPDADFTFENRHAIVTRYIDLSKQDDPAKHIALSDVTMLVWPESAFPFILARDGEELARIGAALPPTTTLVTGAAREEDYAPSKDRPAHSEFFNTISVVAPGGDIVASYDKIHLVPFGEYLPFNALFRRLGLRNFVPVPGGFEPGRVRRPLPVRGMPLASPLICYEAIFPGEVMLRGDAVARPKYLLNVTNDGWFGLTSGPSQHFAQARLRSIEEGLPMVRGAATGVSAVIDPLGRIVASLPLGATGILDAALPEPLSAPPFARFGSWPLLVAWCAALLFLVVRRASGRPAASLARFHLARFQNQEILPG